MSISCRAGYAILRTELAGLRARGLLIETCYTTLTGLHEVMPVARGTALP
jgi:hypothetical protein